MSFNVISYNSDIDKYDIYINTKITNIYLLSLIDRYSCLSDIDIPKTTITLSSIINKKINSLWISSSGLEYISNAYFKDMNIEVLIINIDNDTRYINNITNLPIRIKSLILGYHRYNLRTIIHNNYRFEVVDHDINTFRTVLHYINRNFQNIDILKIRYSKQFTRDVINGWTSYSDLPFQCLSCIEYVKWFHDENEFKFDNVILYLNNLIQLRRIEIDGGIEEHLYTINDIYKLQMWLDFPNMTSCPRGERPLVLYKDMADKDIIISKLQKCIQSIYKKNSFEDVYDVSVLYI